MPHVDDTSKRRLNKLGRELCWANTPGEMVYQAYMQMVDSLPPKPHFKDYLGAYQRSLSPPMTLSVTMETAWRMAAAEFYRLHVAPYEDLAIKRNGRAENLPKVAATTTKRTPSGRKKGRAT
jgi:hypothetical protein